MKIDVEKLIKEVSRHPEIYNPDHKDFANAEIRNGIFNNFISKEMNGIKGEKLHQKWEKILHKYASFIRKLSNDDSSAAVLERFMDWPWTRHMRIFKPQIPEFRSAVHISEMDENDIPDWLQNGVPVFVTARGMSGSGPDGPEVPGDATSPAAPDPQAGREQQSAAGQQESARPPSPPRPGFGAAHPVPGPKPEYAHVMTGAEPAENAPPDSEQRGGGARTSTPPSTPPSTPEQQQPERRMAMPASLVENVVFVAAAAGGGDRHVNSPYMLQNIVTMLGLDQPSSSSCGGTDSGADSDETVEGADDETRATTNGEDGLPANGKDGLPANGEDGLPADGEDGLPANGEDGLPADGDGRSAAKRRRQQYARTSGNALPDLPEPQQLKPLSERGPADFTAQEHMFLAWAKTMSTFTAKRQATVKMKINKILSEAEFEDLDDEFFAVNSPPRRSIYTSRR